MCRLVEDNADEIDERYPSLKRLVSGYNLQKVVYEGEEGETVVKLSKLIVGAEGALGVVIEAPLSLVTKLEETAVALYCFENLLDAMWAVPEALEFEFRRSNSWMMRYFASPANPRVSRSTPSRFPKRRGGVDAGVRLGIPRRLRGGCR